MKNLLIFTMLFYSITLSGQQSRTDSLFGLLSKAKEDKVRVNLLSELSGEFGNSNPDSVFLLASKGLKIAQAIGYFEGEIRCKGNLAGYWWTVGDYATAVKLLLQVLAFYKSQNNPIVAKIYSGLLNSYRDQGDYKEALYYSSLTLKDIPPKFEFVRGMANAMRGSVYYEMNNLDSAQFYLTKALNYPLVLGKGWILLMNGRLYAKMKKIDTAGSYYRQAIEILQKDKNYKALAGAFISTGELYEQTGNIDSAIYYGKQGLDIAQKKKFNKETVQSYLLLSSAYEKVNTKAALQYYKLAIIGKDSLFNQEKQKQLLSFKFNEELQKSEMKNAQQQSVNKNRVLILLILLTCFVLFIIILVRNNRHKQTANRLLHQQKEEIQSTLSQLRSTQAQLIQSEKLASLGELTAGIAHEIQNPLNFVNNFAEVSAEMLVEMDAELDKGDVQEAKAISADLQLNLSKINHHGQRASSIVKGMLEHSRTSTGVKEPTDLNALADEYLRLAYHGLRAKDSSFNATMETHFDPDLPLVSVIPQDIGRVLLNLISNAFYAVNERAKQKIEGYSPTVTVSSRKLENAIEITVQDNGNGIPEAIREKIFQPFFTTKPTGQGTGLGLSLAYDIVMKGHGGALNLETTKGEGSTFIITLINHSPQ
ncbi:MAG TPA: ATP-binding protein [Haliscomenobacter sp.]|uniref:tetratricopeptide repeat-containing sensor histidine kinase n=1 Tax=Haliscomenobacter sp. TaxID=2717303 RepID=UPI002CCFB010|nr:ATP-binding protein [Haliscomenobacter sp.]HOY17060.1 ATP-binding protein [Haliscomenobacter sp.]